MNNTKTKYIGRKKLEARNFYIYTAPWLIGFLVLTVYPVIYSFVLSFTDTGFTGSGKFVGFENWKYAFTLDPLFLKSFGNTIKYVVMFVPSSLILAFFTALLLSQKVRFLGFFRTVFYLPYITAGVATTILMGWIFNSDFGMVNYFLSFFHVPAVPWLNSTKVAMVTIVIMSLWTIGNNIIIMLAGIQDIPSSYYESAKIDGASELRCVFNITIPLCTPSIYFNLIISTIASFQIFQQPYILTKGGPLNATYTISMHLFTNAFEYGKMGYSSMMAWGLFIVIMTITLLIQKSSDKWVFYDT
ncbi:sugar ABC transporter permease [Spirochaetia bacterium]|nr:sugar ABC transporter permease [Spirochaetia bacterium]